MIFHPAKHSVSVFGLKDRFIVLQNIIEIHVHEGLQNIHEELMLWNNDM